jgi:hypothetical protein
MMSEELSEAITELLNYFEMDGENWPMVSVYSGGEYTSGVIDDELYGILTNISELRDEFHS